MHAIGSSCDPRTHLVQGTPPLPSFRVGVMLESLEVPKWVHAICDELAGTESVRLFVIAIAGVNAHKNGSAVGLLHDLWCWLEQRVFGIGNDAAHKSKLDPSLPVVQVHIDRVAGLLPSDEFARIKEAHLDLLLNFAAYSLARQLAPLTRLGVWSLRGCEHSDYRASAMRQHCNPSRIAEADLEVVSLDCTSPQLVGRLVVNTDATSLRRTERNLYCASSDLVLQELRKVTAPCKYGTTHNCECPPPQRDTNDARYLVPARAIVNSASTFIRRQGRDVQWMIAYRQRPLSAKAHTEFHFLCPPADSFYADPFVVENDGSNYIFFEKYSYDTRKGVISTVCVNPDDTCTEPKTVLRANYHLSYPFVFQHEGSTYLLPETSQNRTVELYRCVSFPDRWEVAKIVFNDVRFVDCTIVEHDGLFWLFAAEQPTYGARAYNLRLFWAESPLGPFNEHPRSPIVSDVRSARPAGRILLHNGQLIRPAQDGSISYGHAISFNRIDIMTTSDYRESPLARITPECFDGASGIHTFNQGERLQVIDIKRLKPKSGHPSAAVQGFARKEILASWPAWLSEASTPR